MSERMEQLVKWGAVCDEAIARMMGDREFYEGLLDKFYQQEEWKELEERLRLHSYREAFRVAHDIKGVTATLGLVPLTDTVSAVVEDLREPSMTAERETRLQADVSGFFEKIGQFVGLMEAYKG